METDRNSARAVRCIDRVIREVRDVFGLEADAARTELCRSAHTAIPRPGLKARGDNRSPGSTCSSPPEHRGALLLESGASFGGVGGGKADGLQVALVFDRLFQRHGERSAEVELGGLRRDWRP